MPAIARAGACAIVKRACRAAISVSVRNPSLYDPRRRPQQVLDRRNTVIDTMLEKGWVSERQARQAALHEVARGVEVRVDEPGHGHLPAGIDALASRAPVRVEIDVSVGRLPAPIEATAYFVVAEALTNVAKHASAGHAEVVARIENGMLRVEVRDDGVGGASPAETGRVGLADRLAVFDGRLEVDSPPGAGTRLAATIPLPRSDRSAIS